ncbi:MAG TPA: GNAT family N-acetyltransferase [Dehalococcoidia bacterium]|nr:GNAT family N-acetyltransferase [Dehalococcoidia bacterium]
MTTEIRAARADEMAEFSCLQRYVFAENDAEGPDAESPVQPDWTTCAFVDGRIAATMGAFLFRMRLNGAAVDVAGVTAVGTYPEYRRTGLLRRVMEQGLREQREREQSLAILWASFGAIYQRFGYGLASTWVRYELDPRQGALEDASPLAGAVRLLALDEARPIIERLYIEYSGPRTLDVHRAPAYWDSVFRERPKRQRYAAVYFDEGGEPRGYALYETKWREGGVSKPEPGPNQLMTVQEFVAVDVDAFKGLWEYLCRHDLVARIEMPGVPEDDPARSLMLEPRELRRITGDGIWLRVVDVERALPQRPYGDRGELSIAIVDDGLCEWNNGTYLLETNGVESEVTRTDREPDISMPARSLASLISGHDSASYLARAGLIEARDEQALSLADRLFATVYRPHCGTGF